MDLSLTGISVRADNIWLSSRFTMENELSHIKLPLSLHETVSLHIAQFHLLWRRLLIKHQHFSKWDQQKVSSKCMYYHRRTKAVHLAHNYYKLFENWIIDSCGIVLTNYCFSSAYCQFIDYRNYSKIQVGEQRFLEGTRGPDWTGPRAGCGLRARQLDHTAINRRNLTPHIS